MYHVFGYDINKKLPFLWQKIVNSLSSFVELAKVGFVGKQTAISAVFIINNMNIISLNTTGVQKNNNQAQML